MILKQMNAKMRLDLFRMNFPNLKRTMVVGVDSIVKSNKVTLGLTASYNQHLSQYYHGVRFQLLPEKSAFLTSDAREQHLVTNRTNIIA